jgi:iron complex transport system substrate-binding protein
MPSTRNHPSDHLPHRIVSLQPSATVIIDQLGLLDRLVACTKYCADVCPEAANRRANVADSWTAQASEILAARPDLVIASVPYQEKAVVEILKAGVRFLGFAPRTLSDIYGDIAAIAGILGAGDRGTTLIEQMQQALAGVRERTRGSERPRVYCEEWGKPLIHSQRWVAELVETAGGEFIGPPGKQTTAEHVAEMKPDVIIAAWCGAGDRVPLEKIIRERRWQQLSAAQNARVFCIRDELLNTPAPTLIHGLYALAHAIHPELFPVSPGIRGLQASVV